MLAPTTPVDLPGIFPPNRRNLPQIFLQPDPHNHLSDGIQTPPISEYFANATPIPASLSSFPTVRLPGSPDEVLNVDMPHRTATAGG